MRAPLHSSEKHVSKILDKVALMVGCMLVDDKTNMTS